VPKSKPSPPRSRAPNFVLKTTAPDYYRVLGVGPKATDREIRDNYYELARRTHPDMGGDEAQFAVISEAWATLRNRELRKTYDARRKFLSRPCPTCKGEGRTYKTIGFTRRQATVCKACGGTGIL
jgi:DnaJ-class molecular chaperone